MADIESPGQENQIKDAPAGPIASPTGKIIIAVFAVSLLGMTIAAGVLGAKLANVNKSGEPAQAASGEVTTPPDPPPGSGSGSVQQPDGSEGDDVISPDDTPDDQVSPVSTVCLDPNCVSAASKMIHDMNQSVDPCENFYDFACGGGHQKTPIPDGKPYVTALGQLEDIVQRRIQGLLEEPPRPNELALVVDVKDLYKSCVDMDTIDGRGMTPFMQWLTAEVSPWPLLTPNMSEADLDLTDIAVKLANYSINTVVLMQIELDIKNASRMIITMDQPTTNKREQIQNSANNIKGVASLLGRYISVTINDTEVMDFVQFGEKIVKLSSASNAPDPQATYNPTTLGEFHTNYSSNGFDFKKYIKGVMAAVGITDITDAEVVINKSPQFFQDFQTILDSYSKTTVANFMIWKALFALMDTMVKPLRNFKSLVQFTPALRKRHCTQYVDKFLGIVVAKGFVDKYTEPGTKAVATEMIAGLQAAFNELLKEEVDWMDDATKILAREKNDAMKAHIVYPDYLKDPKKVQEIFKTNAMPFEPQQYFENILKLKMIIASESNKILRHPSNMEEQWLFSPQTVNAFYLFSMNTIVITAGMLQPPVFSTKYPKYLAYAGVGSIIGHEITHGFDNFGADYNKDGAIQPWWKDPIIEKFNTQKQCIIDQYNKYKVEEINMTVNGTFTQGENIADNGGVRQAFRAYQNWVKVHGTEPTLPGLNYTVEQLFFIRFGQFWCQKPTEAGAKNLIKNDNHSPGRFRVIGSASNFDEFAKAFNCPRSSYMNPEHKCTVW